MWFMKSLTVFALVLDINSESPYVIPKASRIITGGRGIYSTVFPKQEDVSLYSKTYSGVRSYPVTQRPYSDETNSRDVGKSLPLIKDYVEHIHEKKYPTVSKLGYGYDPTDSHNHYSYESRLPETNPNLHGSPNRHYLGLPQKYASTGIYERRFPLTKHINYAQGSVFRNKIEPRMLYKIRPEIRPRLLINRIGSGNFPTSGYGLNVEKEGNVGIRPVFSPLFGTEFNQIGQRNTGIGYGTGYRAKPYGPFQSYNDQEMYPSLAFPTYPSLAIQPYPMAFPSPLNPRSPLPSFFASYSPYMGVYSGPVPVLRYQRVMHIIPGLPRQSMRLQRLNSVLPESGSYRAEIQQSFHSPSLGYRSEVYPLQKTYIVERKGYSADDVDSGVSSEYNVHNSSKERY